MNRSVNQKRNSIPRDISWLSFNARVLQEAADESVSLNDRIKFLGIFSNNLDEFFRVRVAALKRMIQYGHKAKMHLEENPQRIIDDIQEIVLKQQAGFRKIWQNVMEEMRRNKVFLVTEKQLNTEQKQFVRNYYEEEVSSNIIPLMIEDIAEFPSLREKSIYLGVVMWKKRDQPKKRFALIEIPSRVLSRFVILPSGTPEEHHIILLEDVIRYNMPSLLTYFGCNQFKSHIFKVTRDAELDIDDDVSTNIIQKIEKGLKNRRKGKPVRFVYDRAMDSELLNYLTKRLNLTKKDNIIPGGRIHNFRHFMDFPASVFKEKKQKGKPILHPQLAGKKVTTAILKSDIMLHFPYHSFVPLIDLLREAAFDPDVTSIKITAYRLATQSKIINALINAVRNGKEVTVMLELRARFEEEANLEWKDRLEEVGAKVLVEIPNLKVHSKICVIRKKQKNKKPALYGFVSTGNLNEKTAKLYGDHCLLTANPKIMADVVRIFKFLEQPKPDLHLLKKCKHILPSPFTAKNEMLRLIDEEIKLAKKNKPAIITLKMNSLSDMSMIQKLYEAAKAGVELRLIIRGIFCMLSENRKFAVPVKAISIVDGYLEHARVWVFHNNGKEKVYISSADWMLRNMEHRVEATCPVWNKEIKEELKDILSIQLSDNVKARILNNTLSNEYVKASGKRIRSQMETYNYLAKKKLNKIETGSN